MPLIVYMRVNMCTHGCPCPCAVKITACAREAYARIQWLPAGRQMFTGMLVCVTKNVHACVYVCRQTLRTMTTCVWGHV